jgi:hypothetical protein
MIPAKKRRPIAAALRKVCWNSSGDERIALVLASPYLLCFADQRKLLAPACNVCLIRKNLSTIWCEVTSSIRTREAVEASEEDSVDGKASRRPSSTAGSEADGPSVAPVKELLLCLRPIREGEKKVAEEFRFVRHTEEQAGGMTVSASSSSIPPKKRKREESSESSAASMPKVEQSVVESLMLMTQQ